MVAYLSILVALIGGILYFTVPNAKLAELSRLAFGCGLLAFLFGVATKSIELLR